MHMVMSMMRNAFATPGTARARLSRIFRSDLTRLKRRKTRSARTMRSMPSGPGSSMPTSVIQPTATVMKSKTFQPSPQKSQNQCAYMFQMSSTVKM